MTLDDLYAAAFALTPVGGTVFVRRCMASFSWDSERATHDDYDVSIYAGEAGSSDVIAVCSGNDPEKLLARVAEKVEAWRAQQNGTAVARDTWAAIQRAQEAAHG